jgi:uncharacterized membrane protein
VVLAGVALRGHALSDRSLWYEEVFCWRVSQFPWEEVLERSARDAHPPLYFLLLKAWSSVFGGAAVALRALSVLLGCGTILGMYLFLDEAYKRESAAGGARPGSADRGTVAPIFLAALVALSVFQARWSWEVRMYSLGTTLVAFSSWALLRAIHSPGRKAPWVAYGVLTVLFLYTHYYAVFSVAAQALFLAGLTLVRARGNVRLLSRQPLARHAALSLAAVTATWLPWLPTFIKQHSLVKAGPWLHHTWRSDGFHVCYQMFVYPESAAAFPRLSCLALTALCGAGLLALLWKGRALEWYVVTMAALPVAVSMLVSFADTNVFNLKYLLFAHLFLLAGLAVLVAHVPWRPARAVVMAFLLVNSLWNYVSFREALDVGHKPGMRAAAELIARERGPQEPVVVSSPFIYFSALYHLPPSARPRVCVGADGVAPAEGAVLLQPEDVFPPAELSELSPGRVWVIDTTGWLNRTVPVPPSWVLVEQRVFPEVYRIQGAVVVTQYECRAGP